MTLIGIALAVIAIVVGMVVMSGIGAKAEETKPVIELHPAQLKFMEEKEAKYCNENTKGKGIRVIIDYMRDGSEEVVQRILNEAPQFSEGYVRLSMEVYSEQFDFLSEHGVKRVEGEEAERYKDISNAFRKMLDYAMRMEKEGSTDVIKEMYESIRCRNSCYCYS